MIEIYKTRNDLNHSFMRRIVEEKVLPYNFSCSDKLQLPKELIQLDLWGGAGG